MEHLVFVHRWPSFLSPVLFLRLSFLCFSFRSTIVTYPLLCYSLVHDPKLLTLIETTSPLLTIMKASQILLPSLASIVAAFPRAAANDASAASTSTAAINSSLTVISLHQKALHALAIQQVIAVFGAITIPAQITTAL